MKKVINFILNYNIQITIVFIISYLLFLNNKSQIIYYFDTDFIRTKFALKLAEKKYLTEKEILYAFEEFEKTTKKLAIQITEGDVLLKKSSVIKGGIDITQQLCQMLEFSNCDVYE